MKKYLKLIVVFVSAATFLSGVVQLIKPGLVLNIVGAESTETSAFFFSTVGMFMALFGGLMIHAVYSARPQAVAVFWSMLQKAGAFAVVSIGVIQGLFGFLATGVALFDLFCAIVFFLYLRQIKHELD